MNIAEEVRRYVDSHPFIEEGLCDGIINYLGLARKMQPAIEAQCQAQVKPGAIVMALKRLSPSYYYQVSAGIKNFLARLGQFTVRYDIQNYTYKNSSSLISYQPKIFKEVAKQPGLYYSFSQGLNESTIVCSNKLHNQIAKLFSGEQLLNHKSDLAALTIMLPQDNTEISGIYYFIFKELAWQNINVIEVISTTNEITLVVDEKNLEESFRLVRKLKGN
ncbi:MAG: hypothetical protein HKN76_09980 [Saprospiraceae bacterium]|nr:hypothetical protein [Saprospiraceae bacterium]